MAADYYQPTPDEIAAFDEDLRSRAHLDAEMLRLLALNHWPGKNVRVSVPGEVDWIDSDPDDYWRREGQKQKPVAGPPAAPQGASRPATPQPPAAHPNPAIEQARRDFQDIYGGHQGVKIITAHDGYDHSGRVVDAHLNAKSPGDGLDEQARSEIAALPAYGEPGWGEAKRRLTQIRQAAARRAAAAQQGTQGAPGQAERAAERSAVAGFEGVETGTWADVRRNAGNAFLSEANRAAAKRYGEQ